MAELAGRGYLTEAMRLVLREAFTRLHLHRLKANIQPGNHPSIELVRRCGFELAPLPRDRRAVARPRALGNP